MALVYGMAAALLALFVALACFLVGVQVWGTQRFQLEANQRLNRELAANLIGQGLVGPGGEVRGETLQEVFHAMMVVNPSIEVYLLDAEGRILTYSAPPGRVQVERISLDGETAFYPPRATSQDLPLEGLRFMSHALCWGALNTKERTIEAAVPRTVAREEGPRLEETPASS